MVNDASQWRDPGLEDGRSETLRASFDWAETAPSTAAVEAVAIALDRDPTTIEPIARRVDPDALDAIVGGDHASPDQLVTVSFTYADRSVTLDASGVVVVRPPDVD